MPQRWASSFSLSTRRSPGERELIASWVDRVSVVAVTDMKYSFDVVEEQVSLEISGGELTRDRLANHSETSGSPMPDYK